MPTLCLLVAGALAVGLTAAVAGMRRGFPVSALTGLGAGILAVLVSAGGAVLLPGVGVTVAVAIATGAAPVGALLVQLLRHEDRAVLPAVVATAIWAGVVAPIAIVLPLSVAATCANESCTVEDFGGALPLVVGLGAFLLVPSAAIPTLHAPAPERITRAPLVLVVWIGAVAWLAALELDLDRYTPVIALGAVLAPAAGAVIWVLTDVVRGLRTHPLRGAALGLVAGMAAVLPTIVAVTTPWTLLVGAIAGLSGALAFDARALRTAPITLRVGVAALTVGTIGMIVPGILGTTLGFVFAARIDVLGTQLLAAVGVAAVGLMASIPAAVLLRRGARQEARDGSRWAIPDSN